MCQPANIPGGSYKYLIKESNVINKLDDNSNQRNVVYDTNKNAPTLQSAMGTGGGNVPLVIKEGINTKGKQLDCASTILAGYERTNMTGFNADNGVVEEIKIEKVGQISSDGSQCGTVVSDDGLSGTLSAGTHGYGNHHICTKVQIKQATEKGYAECDIGGVADFSYASSEIRRGRVQGQGQISPTLTCAGIEGIRKVESQYRIRKLTPKECWRLMGFTDEEFEKAAAVNSNTQL